ncbi:PA-phosphatase [Flavobacterium akiainvivens]|uniref:PA-phosphatase n=2 Tax=Flavobacterium akiainvivens TaxID=1202724 RepID=A0A0M9VK18_9FLAO|nr:PA-phosphatase [Flavobacterium akiainvivens]
MKKKMCLWLCSLTITAATAQEKIIIAGDTLINNSQATHKNSVYRQLIAPTILMGFGSLALTSDGIKGFNRSVRTVMNGDEGTTIDDYTRYAPVLSVYALNLAGIKGKNNFRDRTVIMLTANLLAVGTTMALKKACAIERPDGSTNNSFPSGHTSIAFAGAEFLWQEYKDVSPWYGVAGYVVAAGTGLCRIYNDRHWLTDVAAGAGIGILSTKVAYWIYPWMQRQLFGEKESKSTTSVMALPFYNGEQGGLSLAIQF